MSNTIRTFIAAPLTLRTQKVITAIQNDLRKLECNIKWVDPKNIHLTLKFLGDVKTKKIATVEQTLERSFREIKPIHIELTHLGAFPNVKMPQILWVRLKDEKKCIAELNSRLEEECGKIGFKKDTKSFSPHITLGRIKSMKNLNALSGMIGDYKIPDCPTQKAGKIILYKSTLTSSGPIYEALKEFDLTDGFAI